MNVLRNPFYCLFLWLVVLTSVGAQAQAMFSSGLEATTTTTATLWLKPATPLDWVDTHYSAGTGQQNSRMTYNANLGRYEQTITATTGTWVTYSFTYAIRGLAYDSGSFNAKLDSASTQSVASSSAMSVASVHSSKSSSSESSTPARSSISSSLSTVVTSGVDDGGNRLVIWLKPDSTGAAWADVHFNLNSTGQQNLRTGYNSATARYEQVVPVTTAEANLSYAFTYQTPTGAVDSALATFTRQVLSSSSTNTSSSSSLNSSVLSSTSTTVSSSITLSSSAPTTSARSSSMSSIATSSSSAAGGFVQGVQDLGATATVWFKTGVNQTYVILHYSIENGSQINPMMNYNANLNRWEAVLSPLAAGAKIHYNFTYQTGYGNVDSPWFDHSFGSQVSQVKQPTYYPLGGSFYSSPTVTLATEEPQGVIHYTLDGSAPNANSPVYNDTPIPVPRAATINAITIASNGDESAMASQTYVVNAPAGTLNAPVFSHASGAYNTQIRVSLAADTDGAYIHYTLDGSTPTPESPVYSTPIEVKIDTTQNPVVNNTLIKAIAVKAGWTNSAITAENYTITSNTSSQWNGLTTFNVVNGTKGRYSDSQVYWAIIGKDWNTGKFVHVDMSGNLIPMSLGDNGQLTKNGKPYANYFYSLAQTKKITIPAINSARLLMSVGSPMYIWVNQDINGNIGYAGANVENPTDPNTDVIFDFGEFAIIGKDKPYQGIFINTTRVDMFGFPVQLNVKGLDGFNQTVGESLNESRDELFARFITETPAEFHNLAQAPYAPYRIMAPAHASFQTGGPSANYLDDYISSVWEQYRHQNLVINLNNGWPTFTGHVEGNAFVFSDGLGTYRINGKPTTAMAMLGNGYLDDASGASGLVRDKQLQLQAQVCAALNRRVAHLDGSKWHNSAYFFADGAPANYFTKFWHDHALNGLTYGFSYDDVGGYSPSIYTASPVSVTYTIGW